MPTRIVLSLEPENGGETGGDGPALQAAVLGMVGAHDAALAKVIHDRTFPVRPYSITTSRTVGHLVTVEIGVLSDDLASGFLAALDGLNELTTMRGSRRYRLVRGDVFPAPYPQLQEEVPCEPSWVLNLLSPCMVRRQVGGDRRVSKNLVLPEPILFLPRLQRIVSVFAAGEFPEIDVDRWGDRLAVQRIDELRTERHLVETSPELIYHVGSVGRMTVGLLGRFDAVAAKELGLLLSVANFAGVGDKTTVGMGHVRCTPRSATRSAD